MFLLVVPLCTTNCFIMEDSGLLNVNNVIQMFCLHYVFLQRINHSLGVFKDAWNCHPLSTERNLSPLQLWMSGLASEHVSVEAEVNLRVLFIHANFRLLYLCCSQDMAYHGLDWDGPLPDVDDIDRV